MYHASISPPWRGGKGHGRRGEKNTRLKEHATLILWPWEKATQSKPSTYLITCSMNKKQLWLVKTIMHGHKTLMTLGAGELGNPGQYCSSPWVSRYLEESGFPSHRRKQEVLGTQKVMTSTHWIVVAACCQGWDICLSACLGDTKLTPQCLLYFFFSYLGTWVCDLWNN